MKPLSFINASILGSLPINLVKASIASIVFWVSKIVLTSFFDNSLLYKPSLEFENLSATSAVSTSDHMLP